MAFSIDIKVFLMYNIDKINRKSEDNVMGKQINYYMEYKSFIRIAEKALELGCEIIRDEHANEISRGFSSDLVTPNCTRYFFHVPEAGEITVGRDMYGKSYVNYGYSASANTLIEAGYSYISSEEKRISRARLFCTTGYYDENENFINRPDSVTKIYNALVRYIKKISPYTEIIDKQISLQDETYLQEIERRYKKYITEYCLNLWNEGYELR